MTKSPSALPVAVAVVVLFVIAGVLASSVDRGGGGGSGRGSSGGASSAAKRVAPIARRVEAIRGLRFRKFPRPLIVTPAETRRAQLDDIDRTTPAAERRAGEQVLELFGLVEPGTDLRKVAGAVSSEEVAGYYDTRRKRLAIVAGPVAGDRVLSEITLAHELDHALEDQRLGLRDESAAGADDAVSAYTALIEGSATSVMEDYTRRYIGAGDALGSSLTALGAGAGSSNDSIPPYLMSSLLFSYVVGEKFVARLRAVGHGWKLVNYALRRRPPASTEQVIHPEKYLVDERPVVVSLPPARVGRRWRRLARGTIGEFDTDQLLKQGVGDVRAGDAAAGWGGGRYALWGSPGARGCPDPCRRRRALVVGWVWDTRRDAAEFDAAVRLYVARGLSGRPAGPGAWEVGDGAAAVSARGLRTSLVLAPTPRQARRLSGLVARG